MGEIHVGDVATALRATIRNQDNEIVDVSNATTLELMFLKPDRQIVHQTAIFYSDGTDGIIEYVTDDGDLDQSGLWKMQGYVVIAGSIRRSNIEEFDVHANID